MRRGDLVTIAVSGDYGKPRPALVVQSDLFAELPSLTVLQLTSEIRDEHTIRVSVDPDAGNGLRKRSQVMVDRVMTVPRGKSGAVFGRLDPATMARVDSAMLRFFELGVAS